MSGSARAGARTAKTPLRSSDLCSPAFLWVVTVAQDALGTAQLPCTAKAFVAQSPDVAAALAALPRPISTASLALALAAYGLATVDIRADAVVLTAAFGGPILAPTQAREAYNILRRQHTAVRASAAASPARPPAPQRASLLPATVTVRDAHTVTVSWAVAPFRVSPRTAFLVTVEPHMRDLESSALAFVPSLYPMLLC